MFAKRAADFVLKSPLHAGLVALGFYFVPLFGFVSYLVSCFITLRLGARAGFIVLMWALVPVIALMVTHPADRFALSVELGNYVGLWLLALLLRRYDRWSLVISASVLAGAAGVLILHLTFASELAPFWRDGILLNAEPSLKPLLDTWLQKALPYLTGSFVAGFLMFVWTNLILSRYWQALVFNPGGLKIELGQLRLGIIMVLSTLMCMVFVLLDVAIAKDLLPVLLIALIFSGVCLMHTLLSGFNKAGKWFALFYGVLVLSLLYAPALWLLLGILAMVHSVVDVKRLLTSKEAVK